MKCFSRQLQRQPAQVVRQFFSELYTSTNKANVRELAANVAHCEVCTSEHEPFARGVGCSNDAFRAIRILEGKLQMASSRTSTLDQLIDSVAGLARDKGLWNEWTSIKQASMKNTQELRHEAGKVLQLDAELRPRLGFSEELPQDASLRIFGQYLGGPWSESACKAAMACKRFHAAVTGSRALNSKRQMSLPAPEMTGLPEELGEEQHMILLLAATNTTTSSAAAA